MEGHFCARWYNRSMGKGWPPEVRKLFWGDSLTELDWEKNQDYIVQTILEKGDILPTSEVDISGHLGKFWSQIKPSL